MSHPITFQGSISGHNVISGVQANSVNFYLDRPNGLNFGDSLDFNDVPQIGRNLQSAQVDTSVDLNIPDKSDSDFKIPFSLKGSPRIGSFVGRLDHLALLEEYHLPGLSSSYNCNMQQIITIISGLGGIGKTQLALQFAKLHANAFTAIFWISAETKETLQAGFLSIMERAQRKRTKLTINNEELRDQALKATYAWLNHPKNARWLLILDNVDDNSSKAKDSCENNPACDIITQCLDELNHGNIIITTRLSHLGQLGRTLHLDRLGLDDSIQVLRSTIGRHTRDNEGLGRLAARLDGLPLTLNYAGCYMAQKQVTPLQYLEQYEKEIGARKKILQHIPRLSSYNKSMVATWEMSLRAVNEEDALAVTFLEYCSFLYHSDIFYELFQSKNFEDNDLITKCTTDREYFQDLIEILANFSFIRLNDNNEGSTENGSYSIHPVVQDWMRDRVEVKNWAHTLSESISLIGYAHLRTKFTNQSIQRRLVPHADRCILLLARFPYKEYFLFSTLFLLGDVFLNIERTGDAEDICHMALEMYKSFNVESPSEEKVLRYVKIQTKVTLGAIYLSMQKLDLAEKCFLNLVVDPNNSDYLGSGLNLARIFSQRHEYHRADSALTMILEQLNKRLGLQGSVSNSFGEDASFTTTSGHYGQVTEGAQTDNANTNDWPPNEVEQKVDDKWLICDCIRMMADNARKRGSFDEAKEYINLALRLIKKLFGQETRQTVSCLTDLGRIYKYEGKLKESQKALSDAIETAKTVFEGTNTAILKIKGDLVDVLCDDGQYELAESSSRDILQKSKQLFGEANPKTLFSLSNLSVVLGYRGKFDEAEDCARNAFEGLLDTLDWDHANLRNTAITLAVAYGQNNKLTEAKTLFKQVLDHLQQDLPEHIESIVSCLLNLAQVYRDEKQITHSENTYREAIEKYGSKLRHGHITVLHASLGLASLYIFELFDIEKARPLITDVYELCQKTLDRSHPISSRARTHYELLKKLDNVKSNETKTEPQKTLPITYHLTCGNPNSEDILSYAISETAPAVLLTGSPTDPKAEQRFVQSLIDRHHLEKFNAREWRCVVCNLPASDMVHRVNALLRQGIFATGPASAFEPTVVDFAIPVCELYGKCDQIAFEIGSKKLMEHFPIPIASQKECAQCSAKDNLKMCTSCKMARYCSVECQKVAWPSHKMFCKFMKSLREASMALAG